jgi:hypothetical protein
VNFIEPYRRRPLNRDSWRLLLLVFSLGLVLLLAEQSRRPSTWRWLWQLGNAAGDSPGVGDVPTFAADDPSMRHQPIDSGMEYAREGSGPVVQAIGSIDFSAVRDDTVLSAADHRAWFGVLSVLQRYDEHAIEAAATGSATVSQLFRQPQNYRGRLLTVRGLVRRCRHLAAPANAAGLESYYQLVVRAAGGSHIPLVIYCLDLPRQFPLGKDLNEEVEVTGVFFKNWAFASDAGIASAPLILSRSLRWFARSAAPERPVGVRQIALLAVISSVVAAIAVTWMWRRAGGRQRPRCAAGCLIAAVLGLPTSANGTAAPTVERATVDRPDAREFLELIGFSPQSLAELSVPGRDDGGLDERLLVLLHHVRRADRSALEQWSAEELIVDEGSLPGADALGLWFRIRGRVRGRVSYELKRDLAERMEFATCQVCDVRCESGNWPIRLVVPRVPTRWPAPGESLDEPITAWGMFLGADKGETDRPRLSFVSPRVAWHPDRPGADVPLGMAILGGIGMDVALWDDVMNRQPLTGVDREAFFQLLWAAGKTRHDGLVRQTRSELAVLLPEWKHLRDQANVGPRELAELNGLIRQGERGMTSVVPLFNRPQSQFGRLVLVEGTARRAQRIELVDAGGRGMSDIVSRYGMDHYFEVDLFTADSQDNPLVFCFRELPRGFPLGERIGEHVRVCGFFFKSWAFQSRLQASEMQGKHAGPQSGGLQLAPLLVGPAPEWLPHAAQRGVAATGPLLAVLFLLGLLGAAGLLWAFRRGDRRFRRELDRLRTGGTS